MIYSHCDLESAVQLRQVAATFYSAYVSCSHVFKPLLLQRNPWFTPYNMSWADCVLIFVSRVSSWTSVECVDRAYTNVQYVEPPKLLAVELAHKEPMSECFQPLDNDFDSFPVNPRTLKPQSKVQIVKYTDSETVVELAPGKNLILPRNTAFYSGSRVKTSRHFYHVITRSLKTFRIPKNGILHWEHSCKIEGTVLAEFFYKTKSQDDSRSSYLFWNPQTQEYTQYG